MYIYKRQESIREAIYKHPYRIESGSTSSERYTIGQVIICPDNTYIIFVMLLVVESTKAMFTDR